MAEWITQKTIIALLDKFQTSKKKAYLLNRIIKLFLRILNIPIILSKVIKTYLYNSYKISIAEDNLSTG